MGFPRSTCVAEEVRFFLSTGSSSFALGFNPGTQTRLLTFWFKPFSFFGLLHITAATKIHLC